jgi:F420H2:quinone oxidoreductase subunit B/C
LHEDEIAALASRTGGTVATNLKSTVLTVAPARVLDACLGISALPGLYHLSTITAVDEGTSIAVHYHFWQGKEFVEVRTEVPKSSPRLHSISEGLPSATLYEAEVQDLFGVAFEGNPYLGKRLLLPDDYPADAPPPLRSEADPEKIRKMMGLE